MVGGQQSIENQTKRIIYITVGCRNVTHGTNSNTITYARDFAPGLQDIDFHLRYINKSMVTYKCLCCGRFQRTSFGLQCYHEFICRSRRHFQEIRSSLCDTFTRFGVEWERHYGHQSGTSKLDHLS